MTLDLSPGAELSLAHIRYTVEEQSTFHEVNFRMDLLRIAGPTPAHERWLFGIASEPNLMLMQRLEHDWLAAPLTAFVHAGELFENLYRGSAHRVRRTRLGRGKVRADYACYRANSGKVILTISHNDEIEAWIGNAVPFELVESETPFKAE